MYIGDVIFSLYVIKKNLHYTEFSWVSAKRRDMHETEIYVVIHLIGFSVCSVVHRCLTNIIVDISLRRTLGQFCNVWERIFPRRRVSLSKYMY